MKGKQESGIEFTPDVVLSIEITDLPPYDLKIKKNTIVTLMLNSDMKSEICKGTCVVVSELCSKGSKVKIITLEISGKEFHLLEVRSTPVNFNLDVWYNDNHFHFNQHSR